MEYRLQIALLVQRSVCFSATLSLQPHHLRGDGLAPEMVDRALRIAEDQLCPVLAMLRPGVEIGSSWQID